MLTLDEKKEGQEPSYYLNTTNPTEPVVIAAERRFSEEYRSRNLPSLTIPTQEIADAQRLMEMAFCKLEKKASPEHTELLAFMQALKENVLFSDDAIQGIGMLVYLGEHHLSKVISLLDCCDIKNSLLKLKAAFLEEVERQNVRIQETVNHQYNADIFDSGQTENNRKVLQISRLLVTNSGCINSALIPVITKNCLSDRNPHQNEMIVTLNALLHACTNGSTIPFTEHFADVHQPEDQCSEISDAVRATLQVGLDVTLTAMHCKIAILAALLTHDNTKLPPSLFSREILADRMDRFVVQLSYCIKHGKVQASGKELKVSWELGKSLFDKQVQVDRTGTVSKIQDAYWGKGWVSWWYPPYRLETVPSFSQAVQMIGIRSPQAASKEVIGQCIKCNTAASKIVNISEILWEMAAYSVRPKTDPSDIARVYHRGVLGLLSETACPLLLVWRTFIQEVEQSQGLEARYKRIQESLKSVFSHVVVSNSEQHRMKEIYRLLFSHLKNYVKAYEHYNGLYDSKGAAINTSDGFRAVIDSLLSEAKQLLLETASSDAEKEGYDRLFAKLHLKVIGSGEFSYQFAVAYDPRNCNTFNRVEYPFNTPWNEFREFEPPAYFTAFDDAVLFKDPTIQRKKSVGHFVEYWIKKLRQSLEGCEYVQPLHPTMRAMIDESNLTEDLFSERLIQPGLEISLSEIVPKQQMEFIRCIKRKFVPSSQDLYFDHRIIEMTNRTTFLSTFFKALLKVVQDCVELDGGDRYGISLEYTNFVIQNLLLEEQRNVIIGHAIHLFPTNWKDKNHRPYHFVVFFNPVTSNISLGISNGDTIKELDQYDMLESGFLYSLLGLCEH